MCQKVFFCTSTLIVGLLLPEERRLFLKQLLTNSLKLNCCECCIKSESSLWSVTYFSDVRCCLCPCETRFNCDLPLSLFLEIQDIAQMSPARFSDLSWWLRSFATRSVRLIDCCVSQYRPEVFCATGKATELFLNTDGGGVSSRAPHTESGWISLDIHL